jgi:hypothetical protein
MKSFTKFALPVIKAVMPSLISTNLVNVQPMSQPNSLLFFLNYTIGIITGQTYFVKKVKGKWQICVKKDLYDPKYKPYFAITIGHGFAIYNANGKLLKCTDKTIPKKYKLDIESAAVTDGEVILSEDAKALKKLKQSKTKKTYCF